MAIESDSKGLKALMEMIVLARRDVPATKYAIGLLAIIAVGAIGLKLLGHNWAAVVTASVVGAGMFLLLAFAKLAKSDNQHTKSAGVVLLWAVVVAAVAFISFTVSAVAVGHPARWARIIGLGDINEAPAQRPSKLVVLPIQSGGRATPLEGHPILDSSVPIFAGGVRVALALSHDHGGAESISIEKIVPIVKYDPAPIPRLAYSISSSSIGGSGVFAPRQFTLRLNGANAPTSVWNSENGQRMASTTSNLLATDPPTLLRLSPSDDREDLDINVLAMASGSYELYFEIEYTSLGSTFTTRTEAVHIYGN